MQQNFGRAARMQQGRSCLRLIFFLKINIILAGAVNRSNTMIDHAGSSVFQASCSTTLFFENNIFIFVISLACLPTPPLFLLYESIRQLSFKYYWNKVVQIYVYHYHHWDER